MNLRSIYLSCALLIVINLSALAQPHSFASYHVNTYRGPKIKLIFKGNNLAWHYRTGIRESYYSTKEQVEYHGLTGLNFGGHYCFIYLGCGSDCQLSFVADLKTGMIYPGINAGRGYKYMPNSRLLVVNPVNPADGGVPSTIFKTEYYVWNEHARRFYMAH